MLLGVFRLLNFLRKHPVTRVKPVRAFYRVFAWQVRCRLNKCVTFQWLDGARLLVRKGMTGATGNIYCGLHEFGDMAFLLHFLRDGDIFVDVGANVGTYTVLASRVCAASSIAVEPDPHAASAWQANVELNGIVHKTKLHQVVAGSEPGSANFSIGLDTVNHVLDAGSPNGRLVSVETLDVILGDAMPILIKIDVEGFESEVLRGATRTLAKSSLVAIEIETVTEEVERILDRNGFSRRYYDPFTRELRVDALDGFSNNALFVREIPTVSARLQGAPKREVFGVVF